MSGLGIERAAGPVGAVRHEEERLLALATPRAIGGVKIGPILYCETIFSASAFSSGVKSMTSDSRKPWRSNGGGLVGKGCVGEYHSLGTAPFSTGRSSIGHTGSPVRRSKT